MGEEGEEEEEERVNAVLNESTWKFVWDGLSTMLRSALVQASFFLVLACATVLGMYAVAAHQVLVSPRPCSSPKATLLFVKRVLLHR